MSVFFDGLISRLMFVEYMDVDDFQDSWISTPPPATSTPSLETSGEESIASALSIEPESDSQMSSVDGWSASSVSASPAGSMFNDVFDETSASSVSDEAGTTQRPKKNKAKNSVELMADNNGAIKQDRSPGKMMCLRCRAHNDKKYTKNHKCPRKNCDCKKCEKVLQHRAMKTRSRRRCAGKEEEEAKRPRQEKPSETAMVQGISKENPSQPAQQPQPITTTSMPTVVACWRCLAHGKDPLVCPKIHGKPCEYSQHRQNCSECRKVMELKQNFVGDIKALMKQGNA